MEDKAQLQSRECEGRHLAWISAVLLLLTFGSAQFVQGQTFSLVHVFTNRSDGSSPNSITIDHAGNLYGTSGSGVFRVKPLNGGWIFTPLCDLSGFEPVSVTIAPNGVLYGTTITGGLNGSGCGTYGCGVVFRLQPPARATGSVLGGWNETILYEFTGIPDGATASGGVVVDQAGNLYGTTAGGGELGRGTVYKLVRQTEAGPKLFCTRSPVSRMACRRGREWFCDQQGNLYGTTTTGTSNYFWGTVYKLSPIGSSWTESLLYAFQGGDDGGGPVSRLIFDPMGNLYGTAASAGSQLDGTTFELTPNLNGTWSFDTLYDFSGSRTGFEPPYGALTIDAAGNLYGSWVNAGAHGLGSVFKLTPGSGGWTYTSLHDFTGGVDGSYPISGVVMDANGNLYGGTLEGGAYGAGVLFEITP